MSKFDTALAIAQDEKFYAGLGVRLRMAREHAGLPQPAVAVVLGCSFSQVSRYELGRHPVTVATLMRLAKLYKRDITWFFIGVKL